MRTTSDGFVVLVLGGGGLGAGAGFDAFAGQIVERRAEGLRPVVVCGALPDSERTLLDMLGARPLRADPPEPAALAARYRALAEGLGLDPAVIGPDLLELERLALGIGLLGGAFPGAEARLLAIPPRMAARLGAAALSARGIDARWVDAREVLTAEAGADPRRAVLAAERGAHCDLSLSALDSGAVVVIEGGVARSPDGETVVLGDGGADASAAVLAAGLRAERCELWGEGPGVFTADPQLLPGARLLYALDHAEAQQIAAMSPGAVHPRALLPLERAGVPLVLRDMARPRLTGTRIGAVEAGPAQVKAIRCRKGLALVSMDTPGMWHQVGFLAAAFGVFARLGLSVDALGTSETEVTATLDPLAEGADPRVLDRLVEALAPLCRARVLPGCASISLVGRGIRGLLHQLAPVFELFEEHRVHLVSQAASDLNLTFVVDEGQADRLVARLHALLFAHRGADALLGPTWQELSLPGGVRTPRAEAVEPWWLAERDALLAAAARGTPAYVLHQPTLDARADGLLALESVSRVLYAIKANPHPDILRRLAERGLGFETVSAGEIARVRASAGPDPFVLFTPNFAPRAEIAGVLAEGSARLTLDDAYPLEHWPELFAGRELFVRVDPGRGRGHHAHVRTAGPRSKFGVSPEGIERVAALADAAGAHIVGLHAHAGSGVLDPGAWRDVAAALLPLAARLPRVRVLDLGGGLGVPDRPGRSSLDLAALDEALAQVRRARPDLELWLEPGRYLVAEAVVLLATVTQIKRKADLVYVGADAGMHTLLRPALYGAYHPVINLSRPDAPISQVVTVVGPICETGDVLARDRAMPEVREGDVLLIGVAGAYGAAMASGYNLRGLPAEVTLGR